MPYVNHLMEYALENTKKYIANINTLDTPELQKAVKKSREELEKALASQLASAILNITGFLLDMAAYRQSKLLKGIKEAV